MRTSIIVDREDIRKVEEEEQYFFVQNVLSNMGLPLENCFPESNNIEDFTVDLKIKLREILNKFKVLVLNDRDGGVKIYVEDEIVAEWKKCRVELKEDIITHNPNKKIYAVIYIDNWSIFENNQ